MFDSSASCTRLDTSNSLECGHSFCAPCLRRHFVSFLTKSLARLIDLDHTKHHQRSCQSIPKTTSSLVKLVKCVRHHRLVPEQFFRYPCPVCARLSGTQPVINYTLRSLLEQLHCRSAGQPPNDTTPAPFRGLFLTEEVREELRLTKHVSSSTEMSYEPRVRARRT